MANLITDHIEIVEGPSGPKAKIAGHRIRVPDVVIWHERLGMSADEIVYQHPSITMADVSAALAYYWDHRDAIEIAITREREFVEAFHETHTSPLEEKLKPRPRG